MMRAYAIAKKDMRIYYLKGPVVIFGVLSPTFLFLAFIVGRDLPIDFLIAGLLGMTVFFTSTSVSPVVAPTETQSRNLERLAASPVSITTILIGDILASVFFGVAISFIPVLLGIAMGVTIIHPFILILGIVLAAFCFSAMGLIFSSTPTSMTSTVMMLSTMIKFPLVFISGIFIPIGELSLWGKALASLSPLTYITDLCRYSIQGNTSNYYPVVLDISALIIFLVIFMVAAVKLHERSLPKRL
ncbi:MAG: ABC-2 type transporter [ANME-2 cluster archaeon HR1]|jgi:ABC-2 type transport system permease protein|nr:MAG: ABC-2 type transport system permease protein [ANME-2 cluster archaeon]KAF5424987.1 ABC-2 type transport system permease protein [ANME-2 cluster archaeon]PPA78509.1 MAG: ABC-2 type transporter [ANME-2 cluster archaeon HR1]